MAFIDEETHLEFPASELMLGDVLLNITGASIGRSAIADAEVVGGNVNQHVCIVRPDKSRVLSTFLCSLLNSRIGQSQIDSFQAGGNREGLNFQQVRAISLNLPPPLEQEAIAEALSDADEAIRAVERLLAKKRAVKQAGLQTLLSGQTRLPGFGGKREMKAVGELVSIRTGTRNTQDRIPDGAFPFFVRSQKVESINTFGFDCEAVLTAGDGVGTGKIFHYVNGKFDAHQRVYILSDFSSEVHGRYFFFVFSQMFYERIMQMTAKSSVDSVRREMIADMLLPVPTFKEQSAIAEVLIDMEAEIDAIEARLDKLRAIKQGMMQELLTGRTRLI